MMHRLVRIASIVLAAAIPAVGCSSSEPTSASPEDVGSGDEALTTSFAAGSLVVPMDTDFQDTGTLKAFGLVYALLTKNVPVSWVVQTGKAQGGVDFVASGKDLKTSAVVKNHGYRAGPFVIDAADRAAALPIIQAFQAANTVTVHDMTAGFSADVRKVLVAAPRIAVFVDGSEDIAFRYLNAAGIPDSLGNAWPVGKLANYAGHPDVLTEAVIAGPTSGGAYDGALLAADGTPTWCQITSMHYNGPGNAETIREVRGWLAASRNTHAFMECAATETFENSVNGHFLTTKGISPKGTSPDPVQPLHPDSTFAQYDGTFTTVGGSVAVINLAAGSAYHSSDVTLLNRLGAPSTTDVAWMTGHLDGDVTKGKVSYLVGHQYTTSLPITQHDTTNGVRLFLDSLFETDCGAKGSQPSLTFTKSAPASITGNTLTYTLGYGNAGPGIANQVTLVDPIPTGSTFVSATGGGTYAGGNVTWSLGNLSVNESGSVSFTVSIAQDGTYTNQAKLKYLVGVSAKEQASNTTSTTRTAGGGTADVAVTLADSPDPVLPGGTITYSVGVTNAGPGTSGVVTLTDAIPAGSTFSSATGTGWSCTSAAGKVTCTHAALASGASAPLTIKLVAPANAGTVTNSVSVGSPTADPTPANNAATTTTTVTASADLSVTMTASPSPVAAGGALTYAVNVSNAGPSASGTVTYTDTLPAGVTFTGATGAGWSCTTAGQAVTCTHAPLASGASAPLSIGVTMPQAPGSVSNTGTVTSGASDPSGSNNSATVTTTVGPASSDVGITMTDAPDPVVSGGTISYGIDVTNAGPSPSGVVTVTDTLPLGTTFQSATGAGWTCTQVAAVVTCTHAALPSGADAPLTIVVAAPATPGTVTNTAVVAGVSVDPAAANNTATATTTVSPPPGADLSVTLAASPDPVGVGGAIAYAVGVSNAGPSASGPVTVTDTLPAGATFTSATGAGWTCTAAGQTVTCTHAALASGGSAPLTLNVTAPSTPGTISNTVAVSSTSPDPAGTNDKATTTTVVTGGVGNAADLGLTVTESADPVQGGATETYTITTTNAGPSGSGPLTLVDTLPTGATFGSAAGAGWTCNAVGSIVTCTHAALGNGQSAPLTLTITAPLASGTMTNSATVTSTSIDPNANDDTVITTTTVNGTGGGDGGAGDGGVGGSDVSVSVSATPNPVAPGGVETYTVTATNSGPDASGTVTVTQTLPAGATYQGATGAGWTCAAVGQVVTCTHGPLGNGESSQVQIQVKVPSTPGTIQVTTGIATAGTPDPNASNNTVVTTTTVGAVPDAGACAIDADCGGTTSGTVCDASSGLCIPGCRGQGGNGCPTGQQCTSPDTSAGQCVGNDGGIGDGGLGDGATGDGGGEGDGGTLDDGGALGDGAAGDGSLGDGASGGGDAAPDTGSFGGGGCDCRTAPGQSDTSGNAGSALAALGVLVVIGRRRRKSGSAPSRV